MVDYTWAASSEVQYPFTSGSVHQWAVADRTMTTNDLVSISGITNTSPITYPVLGRDGMGPEYTYVPKGANLYALVSFPNGVANALSVGVTTEGWLSPNETAVNTQSQKATISAGTNAVLISLATPTTFAQWLRPRSVEALTSTSFLFDAVCDVSLVVTTGTAAYTDPSLRGLLTITPATKTVFFPLVQAAEFSNSPLPWYATRVTAAALLGTNVSQVLYKGGTVLGGRLSPAVTNMWNASYSSLSALHPAEKSFLALETGLYTYCPPSTDLVFFTDYSLNTGAGAVAAPVFSLSNDSMYNRYFIRAGGQPEQLACTASWHIEFRTSSALFQVGLSPITLEALHAAQLMLSELGFFFENENHKALLGKIGVMTKKYAPLVGDIVSAVHPMAGKAIKAMANAIIPKPGPQGPKPTTANRSGMNGKQGKEKQKQTKRQEKGKRKK